MDEVGFVIESRDGTKLSAGRVGSGSPLVLVHGGLLGRVAWQFVAPLLAERHTVWSYDRRGHGDTPLGSGLSLDQEVEDLAAVLAQAGSDAHLVGHSVGAALCLEAARQTRLRSLVLYEPAVHIDRLEGVFRRGTELLSRRDVEAFLELFLTEVAAVTDEELAVLRSLPEAWAQLMDGATRYVEHSDVFADQVEVSITAGWEPERYRSVEAPTLLLVGGLSRSPLFASPDDLREAVPHVEVATIEGQRHMATAFDPGGFAEAVLTFTSAHDEPSGGTTA